MKILLIGAGRRFSFVKRLQKAGFEVSSIETEDDTPISKISNIYVDKNQSQGSSLIFVEKTINTVKPDLVLSLNDKWSLELVDLSMVLPNILASKKLAAKIAFNKKELESFVIEKIPDIYPKITKNTDKIILKPIHGNGSKDIQILEQKNKKKYTKPSNTHIEQAFISGLEYSADVYFDKNGDFINGVVRSRDKVVGGEVIESRSAPQEVSKQIIDLVVKINNFTGNQFIGPKCFQFIVENFSGKIFLIEINDRFGGGCLLTLESGLDMIEMLIQEYIQNKSIKHWKNFTPKKITMKRVNYELYF